MAELCFKYGVMGCGKTRDIIRLWHSYNEKGLNALIIKPYLDTKGDDNIVSRDNSSLTVSYMIRDVDNIYQIIDNYVMNNKLNCVLVDESQFLKRHHVQELRDVVDLLDIPVICYGLKADFQDKLFIGSANLFVYADRLEEMRSICNCANLATSIIRMVDGVPTSVGNQVAIDGSNNVTYASVCRKCRRKILMPNMPKK